MAVVITLFAALLVFVAPASAQSTRVEAIAEDQAEKAKQLGAEGPSEAEQIVRRVLLSPLLSGGGGLYPWFGSVFGGTGAGVGVGYLHRLEKAAYFNIQSGISMNSSIMARGAFAAPQLWRGMLQVDALAQFTDARSVSFYGLGQDSDPEARDRYDYVQTELGGNATIKPIRFVSLTGSYSYFDFTTERDLDLHQNAAPGMNEDLTYHITRATVAFDWRPAVAYATRGGFYRVSYERNFESQDRPYSFDAQEYEIVQLLPLVREQFVLAGRAMMTVTQTEEGHVVPAMMAPYIGSGSTLRGFPNRRFTDQNRVILTGEYRWRPSRYLDMSLFVDAGQVAASHRDFHFNEFATNWGIGARFHGPTFTAFRVEIAKGHEGWKYVFASAQPF
jgi:hypothetical protein